MTKIRRVFLPLALLLVLSLGCGFSFGGEKTPPPPAATPASAGGESGGGASQQPTAEAAQPGAEEQSGGGEKGEELSLSSVTTGLQDLKSYRSHLEMTFEDASSGEQQVIEMEMEVVNDPPAQHIRFTNSGMGGTMEIFRIGDQQYFISEGQCISMAADDEEEMGDFINPDDVMGGLEGLTRVMPDETVNGVRCQHYTFDESSLMEEGVTSAKGDVWIAEDGGYVVKYTMQAEGKDPETQQEGHIEWDYQVLEVNTPITIEPPENCGGAASEFPIMDDATGLTTMAGLTSYESPSSFDDVLAFYRAQMPSQGWTETDDSFVSDGNAMLNYTKDGRTVSITISTSGDKVSVLIVGE